MRFSTIFGVILFLISFSSWSQETCKCSLLNIENEISTLNKRDSLAVFRLVNTLKKATDFGCKLQGISIEIEYYCIQKEYKKAVSLITFLENLEKKNSCIDEFDYYLFLNKAIYYRSKNDFEKLSEFAFKALKTAEKLKNSSKKIASIREIVFLFTRMKENSKRWYYVKQAEKIILSQPSTTEQIRNYRWLGYQYENEYTKEGRTTLLDSTILFISKAKKGAIQHQMNDEIALSYRAFEAISYHKKDYYKALYYIDSAIYYAKKIQGVKNIGAFYLSKAWNYSDLGQKAEASKWVDTALVYNNLNDLAGSMMEYYEASEIYENIGNSEKAFKSFKMYSKMRDSILSIDRFEKVNELETKYKTELKDAQIKKLVVLLIVAILGIVLIVLVTTMIQLRRTKQQNQALKLAYETQLKLEKELTSVRDHIAQDFHDDLGNKLARISLLSNLVNGEIPSTDNKLKSKVTQITNDANELYLGTRDFIFSLKSESNSLKELTTYLSDFGEDYFNKTPIKFLLENHLTSDLKLPFYWSKQLIFIFKEAMTNALKYANCTQVLLKFEHTNDVLIVTFMDNGIGISAENLSSTNGLLNMKKRAQKIQGTLEINTQKDVGTTICFTGKTT